MSAKAEQRPEEEAPAFEQPAAAPADDVPYDAFLIHTVSERDQVLALAEELRRYGVRSWLAAEHALPGNRWKREALDVLGRATACALVVGPGGLPGEWGRREVDEAARRRRVDATFRFVLAYLPAAEPVPAEALPLAPDAVVSLTGDPSDPALPALAAALGGRPAAGRPMQLSRSVQEAAEVSGPVTSFELVHRLLRAHPEYGGGTLSARDVEKPPPAALRFDADHWLAEVGALYDAERAPVLHGRLLVDGLARLDHQLRDRLQKGGFLDAVRSEVTPPPESALRRKRDAVETLADRPADVDELGRFVLAQDLAKRMRRMRSREREGGGSRGPFLLHVHGRWGAGKTSLLRFLRRQLENNVWKPRRLSLRENLHVLLTGRRRGERASDAALGGDPRETWIVVEFNAWQHQRIVPPWWWLMAAVTADGSRELRRLDWPRWVRLKTWDYAWRLRGLAPGIFVVIGGLVVVWLVWRLLPGGSVSEVLASGEGIAKSLSVILALVTTVWGGTRSLSRWLLVGSPRGAKEVLRHGSDPLDALVHRFREVIARLHYPVAIFVDDLDRCKETYVVELLEGIQTLFRDVPVTYVVAADRDWITQSFALQYEGFCSAVGGPGRPLGHLFLEKTFQLSAPVPALTDDARSSYLERLLRPEAGEGELPLAEARREAHKEFQSLTSREEIDARLQAEGTPVQRQAAAEAAVLRLAEPELEEETEHMLQAFAPLLEPNPRSMKRLVNAYGIASAVEILRWAVADGRNGQARATPEELALWTILDLRWPLLADEFARRPAAVDELLDGREPPAGAPEWLQPLWRSEDVGDVLRGNAEQVGASLSTAAVRRLVGRGDGVVSSGPARGDEA